MRTTSGPACEEELLPDLEDADLLREPSHQRLGLGERVDVEREDQPMANAVGPGCDEAPAAPHAHLGPTSAATRAAASATGTSAAAVSPRALELDAAPRERARARR